MTCERPEDMRARIERKGYRTGTQFGSLMSQIVYGDIPELKDAMMLPTPVVCLDGVYADKNPNSKRHSKSLATLAYHKMLPTPRANIVNGLDLYNPNVAKRNNGNLEEAISALLLKGLMPTPTTSSRNGGTAGAGGRCEPPLGTEPPRGAGVWDDFPTVSPVCRGDDGFSEILDPAAVFQGVVRSPRAVAFNRWRTESVKAYGNAVVVPLIVQIFRAIIQFEKL